MVGDWTTWYESGQKKTEESFVAGQRNGPYRSWYPNGQMEASGEYVMGSREGEWTYWRNDGTLMEAASGLYRNDQRVRKNQ
jgi:antitoxin component YwqK of YwqJK toxin-antitoxin module